MITTLIAAAASISSIAASDAIASGAPTARISYVDLDLHSAGGRAQMVRRIRSAAHSMCTDGELDPLMVQPRRIACYRVAVASGTTQLNAIAGDKAP